MERSGRSNLEHPSGRSCPDLHDWSVDSLFGADGEMDRVVSKLFTSVDVRTFQVANGSG